MKLLRLNDTSKRKEAARKRSRAWYEKNRQLCIDRTRIWCKQNPEQAAVNRKRGYERNRDRIIARSVQWRKDNIEHARELRRAWVERNPDKVKANSRKFLAEHREEVYAATSANKKKNRHKVAAGAAVIRAIKRGVLIRPTVCSECGKPRTIHAHHDDYSKQLVVRWLCRSCHAKYHWSIK